MRAQSGMITLTLLILLSSLLFIGLLFNQQWLDSYSAITAQRQVYLQQNLKLQQLSQQRQEQGCALNEEQNYIEISLPEAQTADALKHYLWCERVSLFKKQPKHKIHARELTQFIQMENLAEHQFPSPPTKLSNDKQVKLYWFKADQNELELDGDIRALIIAEGDLHIHGKGNIRGAIITGGAFSVDSKVRVAYNSEVAKKVVQQYTRWQISKQGWYDVSNQ